MLWQFQANSRDSAAHVHVSVLPQSPCHPGWHITLSRVHMLDSKPSLAIHFKCSSVHDPPKACNHPHPLATISSFWKSVGLLLSPKFICIISFYIPHIRDGICCFPFSVWLTSLSRTISRPLHVAADAFLAVFMFITPLMIYLRLSWFCLFLLPIKTLSSTWVGFSGSFSAPEPKAWNIKKA